MLRPFGGGGHAFDVLGPILSFQKVPIARAVRSARGLQIEMSLDALYARRIQNAGNNAESPGSCRR